MQAIDFSALPRVQLGARSAGLPTAMLAIMTSVPIMVTILITVGIMFSVLPGWALAIGFIGIFVFLTIVIARLASRESSMMRAFAKANGWQTDVPVPLTSFLGSLEYHFSPARLAGTVDGCRFWVHGISGRSDDMKRSIGTFETLTIEVPRPLPSIFAMPAGGMMTMLLEGLVRDTFALERLSLEGDFDNRTAVYISPGKQIESLEYLTPDVMRVMTDRLNSTVIYFDRYIFVLPTSAVISVGNIQLVFEDAQRILKEILEKQGHPTT